MSQRIRRRGQPMVALAVVLTSWVAARALVWEPAAAPQPALLKISRPIPAKTAAAIVTPPVMQPANDADSSQAPRSHPVASRNLPWAHVRLSEPVPAAIGDHLLQMSRAPLVVIPPQASSAPSPVPYVSPEANPRGRRWSADAWMMLRNGGVLSPIAGPARATYGASQVGAVVRYRLATESGHRPTAYLRASAALVRPHDKEAATGLSARPFSGVPVTVAAELRVGGVNSDVRVRPAVMAVTELWPQELPLGLRGEAYAQAGYVGGKGATAFADGQIRVDRQIAQMGKAELRVGAGTWGGAQEGASRLDLGPAVILAIPLSDIAFARLAADWRFRIAGNAMPDSGPALTLSAGF
jgi:hypothetical protein